MLLGVGSFRFRCSSALLAVGILCACEQGEWHVEILQPTCSDGGYTEEVYLGGHVWRFPCDSIRSVRYSLGSSSISTQLVLTSDLNIRWSGQLSKKENEGVLWLRSNIRYDKSDYVRSSSIWWNLFNSPYIFQSKFYLSKYSDSHINLGRQYRIFESTNFLYGIITSKNIKQGAIFTCQLSEFGNDVIANPERIDISQFNSANVCSMLIRLNDRMHIRIFRLPYILIGEFIRYAEDIHEMISDILVGEAHIPTKRV